MSWLKTAFFLRCWPPDGVEAHHPENSLNPSCLHLILDLTSDMKLISTTERVCWSLHSSHIVHGCVRQPCALELTCSMLGILRYLLGSLTNPFTSLRSLLKCHLISLFHSPVCLKFQLPASPPCTLYLLNPTFFLWFLDVCFWVFNVCPIAAPRPQPEGKLQPWQGSFSLLDNPLSPDLEQSLAHKWCSINIESMNDQTNKSLNPRISGK